jgi:hypothetical protein
LRYGYYLQTPWLGIESVLLRSPRSTRQQQIVVLWKRRRGTHRNQTEQEGL